MSLAEGESPRKKLPHARLNALAGLIEKLQEEGGHADLPDLGAVLNFELDDLLPLVEAGELLNLVHLENKNLSLTELGQVYADANILARKELIAGRILRYPSSVGYTTRSNVTTPRAPLRVIFSTNSSQSLEIAPRSSLIWQSAGVVMRNFCLQ